MLNCDPVLYWDGALYVLQCILHFLLWITVKGMKATSLSYLILAI